MFSMTPPTFVPTLLAMWPARSATRSAAIWGVVTRIMRVPGANWAREIEMSPVPGGMSMSRYSGSSQCTSERNCWSALCSIGPRQTTGLSSGTKLMISIGNFVPGDNPVVWRGPMLHKAVQQFLSDVHWEEPEYLLIDMPPGTGDISISLAQFAPGTRMILVTTPQMAAERVAERAGHMANKVGMKVGGVIENMAYAICDSCGERTYPFGSGGGRELADRFGAPFLGQVPLDPPMRDFADNGKPAVVALPDSISARAFGAIIEEFLLYFPAKPKRPRRKALPLIMTPGK